MSTVSDAAFERETVVRWSDGEDKVFVSTTRRKDITALLANPLFELVSDNSQSGFLRFIEGTLPLNGITFRSKFRGQKSAASSRNTDTSSRVSGKKRTMPANAARCSGTKADGSPCGSLASKVTGRCARHPLS